MDSTVIDLDEMGADAARAKLGVSLAASSSPPDSLKTPTDNVSSPTHGVSAQVVSTMQMSTPKLQAQREGSLQGSTVLGPTGITKKIDSIGMGRSMSEALATSPLMKPTFFTPLDASLSTLKSKLSKAPTASPDDGTLHDVSSEAELTHEPAMESVTCMTKAYNTLQVVKAVTLQSPVTVIGVPFLVFIVLAALGIFGTLMGAAAYSDNLKDAANSAAIDSSVSFKLSVEQTFAPLITLNTYITLSPDYRTILPVFPKIAETLLGQLPNGTISNLQFSPYGIIREGEPPPFFSLHGPL